MRLGQYFSTSWSEPTDIENRLYNTPRTKYNLWSIKYSLYILEYNIINTIYWLYTRVWKVVIKGIYRSAWFLQDSPCGLHVAFPTSSLCNTNPWWVASSWSTNYHHLLLLWLEPSLLETEPLQPSEHSMRVPVLSGTLSTWLSLVCAGDGLPEPSGSTLQYTSKLHGEGRSGSSTPALHAQGSAGLAHGEWHGHMAGHIWNPASSFCSAISPAN